MSEIWTQAKGKVELPDDMDPRLRERLERRTEAIKQHMSEAGALRLPPLLDRRRLEFGIIDECFQIQAAFDRVLVWQIPPSYLAKGRFGDSLIVASDATMAREENEAPRAIIVSAGLSALDTLRSNGIDLGHVVTILRQCPWRVQVAIVDAKPYQLLVLNAGDICGSEDLALAMAMGDVQVEYEPGDEKTPGQHKLRDTKTGVSWNPSNPWIPPDY